MDCRRASIMRQLVCVLLLFLAMLPCTQAQATEAPRLNALLGNTPRLAVAGAPLTIQADIYSTSDVTETVHIELTTTPLIGFAVIAVVYDGRLGHADCVPTLLRVSCDTPIKRWSPVTIAAQLDVPPSGQISWDVPCIPQLEVLAVATLPDRFATREHSIPIAGVPMHCAYIPVLCSAATQ